jgi:aspartate/methionine/tyrosine aminotransferase
LNTKHNIDRLFELRPIRPGKISEISEATASSSVLPAERVNFHIGNPVQDEKLTLYYLRSILNLKLNGYASEIFNAQSINNELGWENGERRIEFLYKLIKNSAPYSPRGGFNIKNPTPLIKKVHQWLVNDQDEPLLYDLGEKSAMREIIISSGGVDETLRILLHSLNRFLVHLPAKIFYADYELPIYAGDLESLEFSKLPHGDNGTINFLENYFAENNSTPVFLVMGKVLSEEARRRLRNLSYEKPLYFIEANDVPNHYSFAREAKLKNRVLRIITPSFISPRLNNLSVTFLAGHPEILKVFESVHFQLKGTPSSSELELLQYISANTDEIVEEKKNESEFEINDEIDATVQSIYPHLTSFAKSDLFKRVDRIFENKFEKINAIAGQIESKINYTGVKNVPASDHLLNNDTSAILNDFFANIDNEEWLSETVKSFLTVFAKEHPEYSIKNLNVVSGSSRTALGLLGFHCGVSEVITCDFSWTYEHCFPNSTFIPLTDDFEIDVDGICEEVDRKISMYINSKNKIAVAINNPHNASGKIFRENDLKELIVKVLDKNVFVIDDLAYQNVLPENSLRGPKTVKQLALELVDEGRLYKDQLQKVISIHSLSKTDSFAGARLTVVEIADDALSDVFKKLNELIKPNIAAILTAYLFYRNNSEQVKRFWLLRNQIFHAKMKSLEDASAEFPESRNEFHIYIHRPQGSMYPRMVIDKLPNGLSLDWLSYGLAAQGIGLVPLSAFARTAKGYELGRKSFRLTLGGTDTPEILLRKTRRVLIDLNRLIAEEKAKYNKQLFTVKTQSRKTNPYFEKAGNLWNQFASELKEECKVTAQSMTRIFPEETDRRILTERFLEKYLRSRLTTYEGIFKDHLNISRDFISCLTSEGNKNLERRLEFEFYKDNLELRQERFRKRSFDRTVHPTQLYALDVDILFNSAIEKILRNEKPGQALVFKLVHNLIEEYLGKNIAIKSAKEGEELVCDLRSMIASENYEMIYADESNPTLLSFWGDWDGSNRPSGQGHLLVASALLENVTQLSEIIKTISVIDKTAKIDLNLSAEINQLANTNNNFWQLLNEITYLTNQLEKRYKSVLPFSVESNRLRKLGMKLGIAQDPLIKLWQHNDRTEHKMIEMRNERRKKLEYYFRLNKDLRKTLHGLIPLIIKNSSNPRLILQAGLYKDILKRFVLTPRIHQKLITAKDQFAINTTVHNIVEINELSGSFGNPGMVMGLQVSMSTTPDALISLDKKFISERERVLKNIDASNLPKVWSIPLFEDLDNVEGVENYLDKVWDYAVQSRSIDQEPKERFSEIICEIFVAGSDLSQQVGQTSSALLYNKAKHATIEWLAKKGLVEKVRMKLGSGEPMQRQGGYYADFSSKPAFIASDENSLRFSEYLEQSTIKSTEFAISPLHGVFAGGDLRTLQSAVSEKMRHLRVHDYAQLLFHMDKSQKYNHSELIRAAEPFIDTRLVYESKSLKELERLTLGKKDDLFDSFAELSQKNFQQIVYGNDDDVVGIHIISYFLSRATPVLRDRPVERATRGGGEDRGQKILERIASTIPLSKHGSLLRAISHNKAQTFMLGINQLTTGLFRAMNQFSQQDFIGGSGSLYLNDRILPRLPVYEILHTIRIFQDHKLYYVQKFSDSFPAGITAFALLREDMDSLQMFLPMLQKELLRRHGIDVSEFFKGDKFIVELLPTLRPDLAVLLQPDIFNTEAQTITSKIKHEIDKDWLEEFSKLLRIPHQINFWREKIWKLLEEPVKNQVKSFVELAVALNRLSRDVDTKEFILKSSSITKSKVESSLTSLLGGSVDDSMKQFLTAAVQYLTRLPAEQVEVPIDIVRALKEVERILRIDEQAVSKNKQELLNFYLAQISRYVGDNG